MLPASKSDWRPSATLETLRKRAALLKCIRDFFLKRQVLEVETPLLCQTSVTDPYIQSIPVLVHAPTGDTQTYYLQTSPEYAMKRLLAAYQVPIFQITKAFRQAEVGRFHNPEFTMLEWYRLHFTHHDLMDEMDELLQEILGWGVAVRKTYAELFNEVLGINPHTVSLRELKALAKEKSIPVQGEVNDRDAWLQLFMMHYIEPKLSEQAIVFIYDFPISQAALARIQAGPEPVAARFEVYARGIELANGFYELQDTHEQRVRFEKNNHCRKMLGLAQLPIDEYLLSALQHGLPDCAGVALGIDRLLMLMTKHQEISSVLSFDFERV